MSCPKSKKLSRNSLTFNLEIFAPMVVTLNTRHFIAKGASQNEFKTPLRSFQFNLMQF